MSLGPPLISSKGMTYKPFFSFRFHEPSKSGYQHQYRHFYINERFGACKNDVGWLVVLEQQPKDVRRGCTYELADSPRKPAFLYSNGPGAINWLDGE